MKKYVILCAITLIAIGCNKKATQETHNPTPNTKKPAVVPAPKPTADWTSFQNKTYGYSISYPPEFTATKSKGEDVITIHRRAQNAQQLANHGSIAISALSNSVQPKTVDEFYKAVDTSLGAQPGQTEYKKTTIGSYQTYGTSVPKKTGSVPNITYFVFRPNKTILKFDITVQSPITDTILQSIADTLK